MFNQYLCSALKKNNYTLTLGVGTMFSQYPCSAQFKILTSILGLKHVTIPLAYLVAGSIPV